MYELAERVHVLRESGEDIDMIPRYTRQDSYMRVIPQEFRAQVERGSEVLIALEDRVFGGVGEPYHTLEALYLRAYHIVRLDTQTVEYIEDHGGRGGLAVRTADYDADLVFRLLVEVLGERVYLDA